jgi:hypothetical protein
MVATHHETHHDTDYETDHLTMHDRLHMPRSKGAASGLLIVLLGLWGGLIPFVGPAFDYGFTPDATWHWTDGRLFLEVIPAAATVLGGLAMLVSRSRISGSIGAWLAAAGGAWFVVGQWVSMLWNDGVMQAGEPTATTDRGQVAEWLGFFLALGVVIVFLAAMAIGRMSSISVRDARIARRRALEDDDEVTTTEPREDTTSRAPLPGRRVRDDSQNGSV